jgi:hypothetical protein
MAVADYRLPATFMAPTLDFSKLCEGRDDVLEGILGLDVLRPLVLRIDSAGNRLLLLDSVPDDAGESIPLLHDEYSVFVDVRVPGLPAQPFVVDTGYCGGSQIFLDEKSFDALVGSQKIRRTASKTTRCVAGVVKHECGVVECIQIGSLVQKNVSVGRASKCVIGADCLFRHYDVTFDFPGGRLFLKERTSRATDAALSQAQTSARDGFPEWSRASVAPTVGAACIAFVYAFYVKMPRVRRRLRRKRAG